LTSLQLASRSVDANKDSDIVLRTDSRLIHAYFPAVNEPA